MAGICPVQRDALAVLVDAVMFQDQLPIFDYGATWEPAREEHRNE